MEVVAICADANIKAGLAATIATALVSNQEPIKFLLFLHEYSPAEKGEILSIFEQLCGPHEVDVFDLELEVGDRWRGLHGNQMAFARIFLAQKIAYDRFLYLDSDLLVGGDLRPLFAMDMRDAAIGARIYQRMSVSIDAELFEMAGLNPNGDYFNLGVMLIDRNAWEDLGLTERLIKFCEAYGPHLKTADQAAFNAVMSEERVEGISEKYNRFVYPSTRLSADVRGDSVLHLLGSPKPWDLGGEFVHRSYGQFKSALRLTPYKNYSPSLDLNWRRVKRAARLHKAYLQALRGNFSKSQSTN